MVPNASQHQLFEIIFTDTGFKMPKFRVIGLERDTGEPVEKIIEAADKDAAAAAAGFMVEVVKKYKPASTSTNSQSPESSPQPLMGVSYRSNVESASSEQTPSVPFFGLQVAGALANIVGVLLLFIGIVSGFAAAGEFGPIGLLAGVSTFALGVIIFALGGLCEGVREIAIKICDK